MTIIQWIFDNKWAITSQALEAIIDIASRNNALAPQDIAKVMHSDWSKYFTADGELVDFRALEAFNYPLLDGTRRVSLAKNVAILPVVGPIFPRSNLMTMSGGSSLQSLSYDFNVALKSTEVDTIIMNYDSPGGEVTGVAEFANMIYQARCGKDKKKIVAYVYGLGASAAYWLASASEKIVVAETAQVGSIGVVAAFSSTKRNREKAGIDDFEIVSSQSPKKRMDPSTDVGKSEIQRMVDSMADVFISAVAKHRKTTVDNVIESYGQGGLSIGKSAVESGMADSVGNLEELVSKYQSSSTTHFFMGGRMNLAELKTQHPETYAEAVAIGRSEMEPKLAEASDAGSKTERLRIQEIESLSSPDADAVIAANKFDPTMTKDKVATLVLAAQKEELAKRAQARGTDAEAMRQQLSGSGRAIPSSGSDDAEEIGLVKAMAAGHDIRLNRKA